MKKDEKEEEEVEEDGKKKKKRESAGMTIQPSLWAIDGSYKRKL